MLPPRILSCDAHCSPEVPVLWVRKQAQGGLVICQGRSGSVDPNPSIQLLCGSALLGSCLPDPRGHLGRALVALC